MVDMTEPASGPTSWIEWIGRASAASLMAAVLVTGYFGVWRWGGDYAELKADRDEWKDLAMAGSHLATAASNRTMAGILRPVSAPVAETKDAVRASLADVGGHLQFASEPTDRPIVP